MEIKGYKGMVDLLPDQMVKFRLIEDVFRKVCIRWGYREVRTPTIEPLYLFTASGTLTPQMLTKLYSFIDWDGWAGERVVLRPDSTIPVGRLFTQRLCSKRFARLFYIQNVFSFGSERRERWQAGVEFIGGKGPNADAELIFLAFEVLNSLDINAELRIGHVGLIKALIKEFGGMEENLDRALSGDISAFGNLTTQQENALKLLLELKGRGKAFISNFSTLISPSPELEKLLKDFMDLLEILEDIPHTIDMASGRGFEYYTGVVFHFYHDEERLGGGGRYDDLLPLLGGIKLPASGFALSIDSLLELSPAPKPAEEIEVFAPSFKETLKLCQLLQNEGYIAYPGVGDEKAKGFKLCLRGKTIEANSIPELLSRWRGLL